MIKDIRFLEICRIADDIFVSACPDMIHPVYEPKASLHLYTLAFPEVTKLG